MRIMNIWISIFGTLILVILAVLGYFVFKIVTFVNDTNQKIENFTAQTKESLDVKGQVCETDTVGGFLKEKTGVCEPKR
jgi:hypothetical protein